MAKACLGAFLYVFKVMDLVNNTNLLACHIASICKSKLVKCFTSRVFPFPELYCCYTVATLQQLQPEYT